MDQTTIGDLFRGKKYSLPGADISKTSLFAIITVVTLLLTADTAIFAESIEEMATYHKWSVILLGLSLVCSAFSANFAHNLQQKNIQDINNFKSALRPKVLINVSITIYFVVVTMWIVALGGIKNSPFASMLAVSPILYVFNLILPSKSQRNAYEIFLKAYFEANSNVSSHSFERKCLKYFDSVERLNLAPVIVFCIALLLGIPVIDLHDGNLDTVLSSTWYNNTYLLIYFLSVLVSAFGAIPRGVTKSITDKFI